MVGGKYLPKKAPVFGDSPFPPTALSTKSSLLRKAAAKGRCSISFFNPGDASSIMSRCACSFVLPFPETNSTSPGA